MRFLQGLLGSFAALLTLSVAPIIATGSYSSHDAFNFVGLAVTVFCITILSTVITGWFEEPEWSWRNYLKAGALNCGIPLLIVMGPAVKMPWDNNLLAFLTLLLVIAISAVFGAGTAAGYRFLAGPKPKK